MINRLKRYLLPISVCGAAAVIVGIGAAVQTTTPAPEVKGQVAAGAASALDSYYFEEESIEAQLLALVTPRVAEAPEAEEEESIYDKLAISITEGDVNVRKGPGTEYEIVGKIGNHCAATIRKEVDGWYKIKSGNVKGYISSEFFVVGDEAEALAKKIGFNKASVKAGVDALNVRAEADKDSAIVQTLYAGESASVVKEYDKWVKVKLKGGLKGFVAKKYVDIGIKYDTAKTLAEIQAEADARAAAATANTPQADYSQYYNIISAKDYDQSSLNAVRQSVCDYAKQFVGWLPYVYGGRSLQTGTDCSGFTMMVFGEFGYSLSPTAPGQAAQGISVPLSEILPGDIVCYWGHVGLYVGDGMIIDMPVPGTVCSHRTMYIMDITDVRRIIY